MTGTYEESGQGLVRQRSVNDDVGYLVLTPLRTSTATVLVVRGFISSGGRTAGVTAPAPPSGTHTIVGRVMPAETASDKAAQLPAGQINSINASEQSSRLGEQVYDGYVELSAGQPGTPGWSPSRSRTCRIRPAARPNRSTSPTSSSGTCSPRLPWPRRSSWPVPSAGGSAPSWTTRRPDHAGGRQSGPAR